MMRAITLLGEKFGEAKHRKNRMSSAVFATVFLAEWRRGFLCKLNLNNLCLVGKQMNVENPVENVQNP
ncbi:MAG: hypothetical protein RSD68_00620 [Oscillospiraceae bacterium]